jgi:hypothetical protein
MNSRIKKIIALEVLMIFLTLLICLLVYFYSLFFIENVRVDKEKSDLKELDAIGVLIDNNFVKFRKIKKVDSLFKLQASFYENYRIINGYEFNEEPSNYFFWVNVRKSISDSTFYFTYASDEIMDAFNQNNNESASELRYILYANGNRGEDFRSMFKRFALNNSFEKYINESDWKAYVALLTSYNVQLVKYNQEKINNLNSKHINYWEYAFIFCVSILFVARYLIYVIIWCFKVFK